VSAGSDRVAVAPATGPLVGTVRVPGDKSIGHRAVLFNAAARGRARVRGLPDGEDVASTISAMQALGARMERAGDALLIEGTAMRMKAPSGSIDCGNSGTTMRLLAGLLAGQGFEATLVGDASLSRRPMERVAAPLRALGARIETTDGHAPVRVHPAALVAGRCELAVSSAQLKSAVLLAGMQAAGRTSVREPELSRDHTERMLGAMGVTIARDGTTVSVDGNAVPEAIDVEVCGDASSAAFFAVAASIVPGSDVAVEDVCLNPTRTGYLAVLQRMGADVTVRSYGERAGEPVGALRVRGAGLRGTDVAAAEVPATIDEIPILAVAAAAAAGPTTIRGAGELRVKESDRLAVMTTVLRALGAAVEELPDGLVIEGGGFSLPAAARADVPVRIDGAGDHRVVMAAAVAALACGRVVQIDGARAASVSYPGFFATLEGLRRRTA